MAVSSAERPRFGPASGPRGPPEGAWLVVARIAPTGALPKVCGPPGPRRRLRARAQRSACAAAGRPGRDPPGCRGRGNFGPCLTGSAAVTPRSGRHPAAPCGTASPPALARPPPPAARLLAGTGRMAAREGRRPASGSDAGRALPHPGSRETLALAHARASPQRSPG